MDGILYYYLASPGAPRELWQSDGTPAGTKRVVQFAPIQGEKQCDDDFRDRLPRLVKSFSSQDAMPP